MRQKFLIIILVPAVVLGVVKGPGMWKTYNCTVYKLGSAHPNAFKDLSISSAKIKAEVADNEISRQVGLGGRPCIGSAQAMLFVFDKPGYYAFWMKDTRFPLDMVWLDKEKRVVFVKSNVLSGTYPTSFVNKQAAQYVIELNAGEATKLGIQDGLPVTF